MSSATIPAYSRPAQARGDLYLSRAQVRALADDELLERWERLYEACLGEVRPKRQAWLRQQLDTVSAEGLRRKLIRWTL